MKLYATVTSERASKGQGGEYLDIEIKDGEKITFATIKVRADRLDGHSVTIWHDGNTDVRVHKDSDWNKEIHEYRKGKRQKGENKAIRCNNCMSKYTESDLQRMQDGTGDWMDACPRCRTDENLMDLK